MAQYRKNRLDEELKKSISAILRDMKDQRLKFVSVLKVDVDSDMSSAKVFVSYFGSEDRADVMNSLKKGAGFVRSQLAKELKTRTVPEIKFVEDNSIEQTFKITNILN
jgi:ribosome-binding factor A